MVACEPLQPFDMKLEEWQGSIKFRRVDTSLANTYDGELSNNSQ